MAKKELDIKRWKQTNEVSDFTKARRKLWKTILVFLLIFIIFGGFIYLSYFGNIKSGRIYFFYEDGLTPLDIPWIDYKTGDLVQYRGKQPTKASTQQIVYVFDGFDIYSKENGDYIYVAKFKEEERLYSVEFYSQELARIITLKTTYDGSVELSQYIKPSKTSYDYEYTFTSEWYTTSDISKQNSTTLVDLQHIKSDLKVYAGYSTAIRRYNIVIRFTYGPGQVTIIPFGSVDYNQSFTLDPTLVSPLGETISVYYLLDGHDTGKYIMDITNCWNIIIGNEAYLNTDTITIDAIPNLTT